MRILVALISTVLFQQAFADTTVNCGTAIKRLTVGQQNSPIDSKSIDQTIQDLAALRLSLDLAKVEGRGSAEVTALLSNYRAREKEVVTYLEKNEIMTRVSFNKKIRQEIKLLQKQSDIEKQKADLLKKETEKQRKEQEQQLKDSIIDGTRAISHRIEPGPFKMGEEQRLTTITKPFEMMATPTTQLFYRKIAVLAEINFPGKYTMTGDPSHTKGDLRPVESMSFDDITAWISALNELSQVGEPLLNELIPRHKKGDVYRLPYEAEWEFVLRGRGTITSAYFFGDNTNQTDIKNYAIYKGNSNGTTQPVAQKLPLIVDGKEFYDMIGNVSEVMQDWYYGILSGGIDPKGPTEGKSHVIRGGAFSSYAQHLLNNYRAQGASPNHGSYFIGFRLVRVVK